MQGPSNNFLGNNWGGEFRVPAEPMDLSPDEETINHVPFTSEACLQRQIAYVITTIAISLIKRKEVLYSGPRQGLYFYNCLPRASFCINTDPNYIVRGSQYGVEIGESLGEVMLPDATCQRWEKRELFEGRHANKEYIKICFAVQGLVKEYMKPSYFLKLRIVELKEQMPIVAEIWNHFQVLIQDFAAMLFDSKERKEVESVVRVRLPEVVEEVNGGLNFGNRAVLLNHGSLYEYVMSLAQSESDFIPCFERVCGEWDKLRGGWRSEALEAAQQAERLTKISTMN